MDLSKPIDKRIYKGTQPTCHDFNQYSATAESVALIVGFSAGQVQYLDPIKKETSKLFNEEVINLCLGFNLGLLQRADLANRACGVCRLYGKYKQNNMFIRSQGYNEGWRAEAGVALNFAGQNYFF